MILKKITRVIFMCLVLTSTFYILHKYFHPLLDFIFLVVFIHYGYTILKRTNYIGDGDKKAEVEWDRQRETMSKKEDENLNDS